MDVRTKIAKAIYKGVGGDPNKEFDTVEDIYSEVETIYREHDNRQGIEPLELTIVESGKYKFDDRDVTGYKPVEIDIQVTGSSEESYNAGYRDGKTDGITEQKSKLEDVTVTENGTYEKEDGYKKVIVTIDTDSYYNSGYNAGNIDGYSSGLDIGFERGVTDQKAKLTELTVDKNGTYEKEDGYKKVIVDVDIPEYEEPVLDELKVTLTENGDYNYTSDNDGYSTVDVKVAIDTQSYYESGYEVGNRDGYSTGKADGIIEQKSKLTETTFTSNGTFNRENGWKKVTVDIDTDSYYNDGYNAGNTAGYNTGVVQGAIDQKAKLTDITLYDNGTYRNEDGYHTVVVDVDTTDAYNNGYSTGVTDQKAKLTELTVDKNGTYEKEDGYKKVIVDVPSSGGESSKPKIYNGFRFTGVEGTEDGYLAFKDIDFSQYDWSEVYNLDYFFSGFGSSNSANGLVTSDFDNFVQHYNGDILSCMYLFNNSAIISAPNLGNMTKNCVVMKYMFNQCRSLQTVPLFDTGNVTNMYNMFSVCDSLQTVPLLDTSEVTNMSNMFWGCKSLPTIPPLNTSKVTDMSEMFYSCNSLRAIPQLDTSNVTNMYNMFNGCKSLQTIPQLDTSKVTDMSEMFCSCNSLQAIPPLNTSKVTNMSYMFQGCTVLQTIPQLDTSGVTGISYMLGTSPITTLTDLGGFKNLGMAYNLSAPSSYFLDGASKLTHDSLMNVINDLYDRKSAGYTTLQISFGSTNLAKLTDEEKAIAINKGWTLK